MGALPFAALGGERLSIHVRLTPRGGADRIEGAGSHDGQGVLLARVRAVPSEGAANAALLNLLAKAMGLPKSALELRAGAGSRLKTVVARGEPERLQAALSRLAAAAGITA